MLGLIRTLSITFSSLWILICFCYLEFSYFLRTPASLNVLGGSSFVFSLRLFSRFPHKYANVRMRHIYAVSLINVESVLKLSTSFLDVVGRRVRLETAKILFSFMFILNRGTVVPLQALLSLMQSVKIFVYT